MSGKSLARLRIVAAGCFFVAICLLFFEGADASILAALQIGPAILALNALALLVLAIAALLFGRIYCSIFCPLGILQDLLARARPKRKYRRLAPFAILRYGIAAIFFLAIVAGISAIFSLVDPYSTFGRIAADIFSPLWDGLHNLLAWGALQFENYAIIDAQGHPQGSLTIAVAAGSLLALVISTWLAGRIWCNFCPVGTLLGLLSRFSLLRIRLNSSRCVACGRCERVCKTGCIDIAKKEIDASRCVDCFNCIASCPQGALSYSPAVAGRGSGVSLARRALFVAFLPAAMAGPAVAAMLPPGREDKLPSRKAPPQRESPITPPGSSESEAFSRHCTGCQLCVASCPGDTIASFRNGLGILQPSLTFEYGYCIPGCTRCGDVCPTAAIKPFTAEEKARIQIGIAAVDFDRCLVHTEKIPCRACYNICPPQIISLVSDDLPEGLKRPLVDATQCIGCGACEFVCPARPVAAIAVNGKPRHTHTGQ